MFILSLQYAESGMGIREGTNAYTPHAFSAYVSAVSALEAFVNETLLSDSARFLLKDSPLWDIDGGTLEKMDLGVKLVLIPYLLFQKTFKRSEQPYQDFALLVRVRNDIVHYKMQKTSPKYVSQLVATGVALKQDHIVWPSRLSCVHGIVWANNAACKVVHGLVALVPEEHRSILVPTASNFQLLSA
jgi:hypothetical protein